MTLPPRVSPYGSPRFRALESRLAELHLQAQRLMEEIVLEIRRLTPQAQTDPEVREKLLRLARAYLGE